MRNFHEQKDYRRSNELVLHKARLSKNVVVFNAVYLKLSKQFEIANIDEVKNTLVVNVKEYAKDSVIKNGRKKLNRLILI